MPFTPFHFGPNLWIGILFINFINVGAFFLSNIIIDIEPLIVMLFNLDYPLHGYMHCYLAVTIVAFPCAYIYKKCLKPINIILKIFKFAQESSFKSIYFSFLSGFYFHIFLDSILYKDITPFFPFQFKPMFATVGSTTIYLFCMASFFVAAFFYLALGRKNKFAKWFFRILSAVVFAGFAFYSFFFFAMGSFLDAGFDDGPFLGIPHNEKIMVAPASTLKINNNYILKAYNRENEEPLLSLEKNGKIIWTQIITTKGNKNHQNAFVSSLKLIEIKGHTVYGLANWTYGNEAITIYLNSRYNLRYFYLSW
nr:hypothetical protein 8 [bacterium]